MSEALKAALLRHTSGDGIVQTAIDGLLLMRWSEAALPHHALYRPALCVTVQGAKQVMFGDKVFDYGPMQALVVSVEMPGLGQVVQASRAAPFLGLALAFDVDVMRGVMDRLETPPAPGPGPRPGVFVDDVDGPLADCVLRLVRLLDTPQAVPVLFPSIMREICFWMLTGPHGGEICKLALPSGSTQRIADAIHRLRDDFARPVRIEQLAAAARMSPSSFHQHFKALTTMSPLQYQKQLRLLEARRLMIADGANAMNAAYRVGYESASQFSREYTRMFGAPPKRDVAEMRALPAHQVLAGV